MSTNGSDHQPPPQIRHWEQAILLSLFAVLYSINSTRRYWSTSHEHLLHYTRSHWSFFLVHWRPRPFHFLSGWKVVGQNCWWGLGREGGQGQSIPPSHLLCNDMFTPPDTLLAVGQWAAQTGSTLYAVLNFSRCFPVLVTQLLTLTLMTAATWWRCVFNLETSRKTVVH